MPSLNRSTSRHDDRGVSALVFAIVIPVIIGAVGLSVDGGRMAIERANLQNASDGAARAVGQDCARASRVASTSAQRARCSNAGAGPTIALAISGNAPGAAGTVAGTLAASSGSARVNVSKTVPMTLGAVIGIRPKSLTATTTVRWDETVIAGNTLPLSMDICDYNTYKGSPSSTPQMYRWDEAGSGRGKNHVVAKQCGSDKSVGGSMWIGPKNGSPAAFDAAKCLLRTELGEFADYRIQPHNWGFADSCERNGLLTVNKTYLVVVGQNSDGWKGQGNVKVPTIRGYSAFVVTGWKFGPKQGATYQGGTLPSSCTSDADCRGVQGYFTGAVTPLEGATYGTSAGADFGAVRVKITS